MKLAGALPMRRVAPEPKNILMYVRKSDDVEEIMEALQDCLLYIKSKVANK